MTARRHHHVPRRNAGVRSARLPVIGLVLVVVTLSVFASVTAIAGARATDQFARSEQISAAWHNCIDALRNELLFIQEYRAQPSSGIANDLDAAAAEIRAAADVLDGYAESAGSAARFAGAHQRFEQGVSRLMAAVDGNEPAMAARIYSDELQPLGSALTYLAEQSVEQGNTVTSGHLRELRRLQTIGMATPVVFAAGLLLLGLFWRILRRYQRNMQEQARESEYRASHDALTGLPNRALLRTRIDAALEIDQQVALLLLDLDRFKEVNDTLGHQAGDDLLRQVSARLGGVLRQDDTLARLGGDEFAVLLPNADVQQAIEVSEQLLATLTEPMLLNGITVTVDGSFGIAVHPEHANSADELLRRADIAMYAAKERHAGITVYADDLDQHDTRQLGLLGELRRAIDNHELVLHYQPKAALRTGEVHGVEALVRWQHPQHGLLGPFEFIPLAERTGLIEAITHHVLDEALHQVHRWNTDGITLSVAVNVPTRCLLDLTFADAVAGHLDRWQVHPENLILEITEGTIMQDPDRSIHVLHQLRALGVKLAIDDFGTGYSSMAYLKALPVHELKVDRSFIQQMSTNRSDEMIVTSTIELAHNLDLTIVAEGVEDALTWTRLTELGCDNVQGYYLAKPMPADTVTDWLTHGHRSTTAIAVTTGV
ncbi:putative bifunctional diguanylate cyclase/phosphodiesterase [Actinoplanes xinjiangensis]|uniref:putative bifunctional diguanylate cyclase/phosphodiesterase n=1 Tax=Actinoplanes xinjiangensis TaxID=512350 RepID=UPI003422FC49